MKDVVKAIIWATAIYVLICAPVILITIIAENF